MSNINLIPTDKPSKLYLHSDNELQLRTNIIRTSEDYLGSNQHIYITSDEEIKEGEWYYDTTDFISLVPIYQRSQDLKFYNGAKKIILSTDQDLIKDGVQAIDDEFLEWFVKNPSCEEVEVQKWSSLAECGYSYHIIILKEEPKPIHQQIIDAVGGKDRFREIAKIKPKQETLEEAAENYARKQCDDMYDDIAPSGGSWGWETSTDFIEGAKWQAEKMYSEEDLREAILTSFLLGVDRGNYSKELEDKLIEQFKKS